MRDFCVISLRSYLVVLAEMHDIWPKRELWILRMGWVLPLGREAQGLSQAVRLREQSLMDWPQQEGGTTDPVGKRQRSRLIPWRA